ncbi:MAG: hypothetical protein E7653_00840 [Ruminococcaceae bacterium]|nr:hypothetical protein [Oscillospiraceae bacterium]
MDKKAQKSEMNKAKKRLLIAIGVIFSLLILLAVASALIDLYENNKASESEEIDFDFYEANYEEDIFLNEEYNKKISGGFISYEKEDVTVGINRDNAYAQGEEVDFIVEMLYDIIYGDNVAYNQRFSTEYYKNNAPKDKFTMQMLYDVKISHVSSEVVNTEAGNYTKSVYTVEYRIYRNNGTFRRDIGNGARIQYITVTNRTGEILIDELVTPTYK